MKKQTANRETVNVENVALTSETVNVETVTTFSRDDAREFLATFSEIPETALNRLAKIPEDTATFRFLISAMKELKESKNVRGDVARDIIRATLQRDGLFFSIEKKETTWNRGLMKENGAVNPSTVYGVLGKVVLQRKTANGLRLEQTEQTAKDEGNK